MRASLPLRKSVQLSDHQMTGRWLPRDRVWRAERHRWACSGGLRPPAAPDRLPRHGSALASRPPAPPAREGVPAETAGPTTHDAQHQAPGPPVGGGERKLGLPARPRRTGSPRHQARPVDGLGDPQRSPYQSHARPTAPRPGPRFCAPKHTRSSPPTSSKPGPWPAPGCTSSPSSNTPPAASASLAPPRTPPRPGPRNWPATWWWTSKTPAPPDRYIHCPSWSPIQTRSPSRHPAAW